MAAKDIPACCCCLGKKTFLFAQSIRKSITAFALVSFFFTSHLHIALAMQQQQQQKNAPSLPSEFSGFLLPVGGGASTGSDGKSLKPAMIEIHRAALQQLALRKTSKPNLPLGVCVVEYHPNAADNAIVFDLTRQLFVAAGLNPQQFKSFEVTTRDLANQQKLAKDFASFCGLAFLPGGDQREMKLLWEGTLFHNALSGILKNGGGLMGKSAGAAILGTVGFFPEAELDASTQNIVSGARINRNEFAEGLFNQGKADTPWFYVETHAGDRERAARALAILGHWRQLGLSGSKNEPISIVIDSDTGILLSKTAGGAIKGKVLGARAVEVLVPTTQSKIGLTQDEVPFATNFRSELLLSGDEIEFYMPRKPSVIPVLKVTALAPFSAAGNALTSKENSAARTINDNNNVTNLTNLAASCSSNSRKIVNGNSDGDALKQSNVLVGLLSGFDTPAVPAAEYAYLNGLLSFSPKAGCGFWLANSFNPDYGQPENRLNGQRYVLASRLSNFSVAIPDTMAATLQSSSAITFSPISKQRGSSVFVYDTSSASNFKLGNYVYTELGATNPDQVGVWHQGKASLIPPGGTWNRTTGISTIP